MARRARGTRVAVLGIDGSPLARRAATFLARLAHDPRATVHLVGVLEPVHAPSMAMLPSAVQARLGAELAAMEQSREATARRQIDAAGRRLSRAGWRVEPVVRTGIPTDELLKVAGAVGADLIVLGARGASGIDRLLLGSVAEGVLKRAPMPVLLVR